MVGAGLWDIGGEEGITWDEGKRGSRGSGMSGGGKSVGGIETVVMYH